MIVALAAFSFPACGAFDVAPLDRDLDAAGESGPDPRAESGAGDSGPGESGPGDADASTLDGSVGQPCNQHGSFSSPVQIGMSGGLETARLALDGLVYLTVDGSSTTTLGTTTLAGNSLASSRTDLFGATSQQDEQPALSADGRVLVFDSKRSSSETGTPNPLVKLWIATRPTAMDVWGAPTMLAVEGVTEQDNNSLQDAWIAGNRLYFVEASSGGLHHLRWGTLDANAGTVVGVTQGFASPEPEIDHPVLSPDELELFYFAGQFLFRTVRTSRNDPFQEGTPMSALANVEGSPVKPTWMSPDGCDLYYFTAVLSGGATALHRISRGP